LFARATPSTSAPASTARSAAARDPSWVARKRSSRSPAAPAGTLIPLPAPADPVPPLLGGSVEPTPPLIPLPAPAEPVPPLLGGSVEPTPLTGARRRACAAAAWACCRRRSTRQAGSRRRRR